MWFKPKDVQWFRDTHNMGEDIDNSDVSQSDREVMECIVDELNDITREYADVKAYNQAVNECRDIFIQRRGQHGSHLEKDVEYLYRGLRHKMDRAIWDLDHNNDVLRDTLVDLVDYALMLLSLKYSEDV